MTLSTATAATSAMKPSALATSCFLRKAVRAVLRQRKQTDAASPHAQRAFGFAAWQLQCSEQQGAEQGHMLPKNREKHNPGQLVFTAARETHVEEASGQLLSADVGFLEKRYRRHGDVERMALLFALRDLQVHPLLSEEERRDVRGYVDIYVDRVTCLSCLGVLVQFNTRFPNVRLRVACSGQPWLPRRPALQKVYGVVTSSFAGSSLAHADGSKWDP
ncbi:unnamed protein product [Polarella glacialis]|uniref:Uncharacterized protein n=1 Tax=Polarella glacialis TaxID=89957 RepID=A0A813GZK7_POLGL|nr:unnamed protein product [Polarella glacialis]